MCLILNEINFIELIIVQLILIYKNKNYFYLLQFYYDFFILIDSTIILKTIQIYKILLKSKLTHLSHHHHALS